jgi:hypothetical protein
MIAPLALLAAILIQDPPLPRPDLPSRLAEIAAKAAEPRRELAVRGLRSLGAAGHEALLRVLRSHPELTRHLKLPEEGKPLPPHATAAVRIPVFPSEPRRAREAVAKLGGDAASRAAGETALRAFGLAAESELWDAVESERADVAAACAAILRRHYAPPGDEPPSRPSEALRAELARKRTFDVADRTIAQILEGESFSWILMEGRGRPVTVKMQGVTLSDFLRIAFPDLAAVGAGDLLVLAAPGRAGRAEPDDVVWVPSDFAPKLEAALEHLAEGRPAAIDALGGPGVMHALRRAARSGGPVFAAKADEVRRKLERRIFFIDPAPGDDGPPVDLAPVGGSVAETLAAFEKATGRTVEVAVKSRADDPPFSLRFRRLPAGLAQRALDFRVNRTP